VFDDCTSATIEWLSVISPIAQAAPTPWISEPRFETWLASQRSRNVRLRKGASVVGTAMGLLRERGRTPPFSPAPPSAARGGEGACPADRFLFLLAS